MGSHSDKFNSLRQIFVRVLFKQLIFKMMKLAVLALCLIAAVVAEPEAEASPEAYYGSYGYGLGYRGYGYVDTMAMDTVTDTHTTDMDMDTTVARDLLMLTQLYSMVPMPHTVMDMLHTLMPHTD